MDDPPPAVDSGERAELKRLRREVAELRMDQEFPKSAAAFFTAVNTLPSTTLRGNDRGDQPHATRRGGERADQRRGIEGVEGDSLTHTVTRTMAVAQYRITSASTSGSITGSAIPMCTRVIVTRPIGLLARFQSSPWVTHRPHLGFAHSLLCE
ncbi:hypothetical protein [Gordonia oryzae]|uniref:hypothetical protein n=1 Tax=Gordonia oryzae TaxID=2487349 RepID=UPI00161CCEB0